MGHTDIQGNSVVGTVAIIGIHKTTCGGIAVARSGDVVNFPSHPHAILEGQPADFRSHQITLVGSSNSTSNGDRIALNGDSVAVADEAGGNAVLVASQSKTVSRS